jgi:hypothetical protein
MKMKSLKDLVTGDVVILADAAWLFLCKRASVGISLPIEVTWFVTKKGSQRIEYVGYTMSEFVDNGLATHVILTST